MQRLIVIPARYSSTRFPGKPLQLLAGSGGGRKSLIQRTWEAASMVEGVDQVVVATDDIRIRDAAEDFGAEAIMTSPSCRNGTERCADAAEVLGVSDALVINVQGDAPLTPPWFVEDLINAMENVSDAHVATPVIRCNGEVFEQLKEIRSNGLAGGTTVVFDENRRALYFSKQVIPWTNRAYQDREETPIFYHVGVYAYTIDALNWYSRRPVSFLEAVEGLEQLRFLESNISIECVEVDPRGREFWELNNPGDIAEIERILAAEGIE
ncbi:MAG: 3-deoxy-manno-octulosonate cytidylyltransferase [Albidovulum sp.]|nr:3-deoxy-manno-octulosonate cytidylyltransferase [Albidovulum sp.]